MHALERLVEGTDSPDPHDLTRLGRLQLELGSGAEAAESFLRAADLYAGSGLLNVALALAGQGLVARPDRTEILLKIGIWSAREGHLTDARRAFTDYIHEVERTGDDSALERGLQAYVQAFPDDSAVKRRLAEISGAASATEELPMLGTDDFEEAALPSYDLREEPEPPTAEDADTLEGFEPTVRDVGALGQEPPMDGIDLIGPADDLEKP